MKKTIKIDVDVPEGVDEEFLKLYLMLTREEQTTVKGVVQGLLLASGRISTIVTDE